MNSGFGRWLMVLLLFVNVPLFAVDTLSDKASISVITCGSGTELYAIFGHSAVRVFDRVNQIDKVYNYGTFDFDAPNFALNFLRGKLTFWVASTSYDRFLTEYYYTQRSVKEQVLTLSKAEKQEIYDFLEWNLESENRSYQYDFYFDNCTTRIRDLFEANTSIRYETVDLGQKTFRDLLHENLTNHSWTRFGMDLILGTLSDSIASLRQQMFLPAYYFEHLDRATMRSGNGDIPAVLTENRVLEFPITASSRSTLLEPGIVFWFLFMLEVISFFLYYISGHKGRFKLHDKAWFVLMFLIFLVLVAMWGVTDHIVCRDNWNILWTCPWMIFWICTVPGSRFRTVLLGFSLFVLTGMLVFWNYIPQSIHPAIIPIVLISLLKVLRRIGAIRWIDRFKKIYVMIALLIFSFPLMSQEKIAGITMVGAPAAYDNDPMPPIKQVNANWVALIPFAFSRVANPEVRWGSNRQWWGERTEGISENIRLAKSHGMKIMLKPQVWIPRGWVGEMDFDSEASWELWESQYQDYILHYVDLAVELGVEMFCVGTEFRISVQKREAFWRNLVKEIRARYKGHLVYSANWDAYEDVPFWDVLDFIGISSYFPLTSMTTPPEMILNMRWKKIKRKLRNFSDKLDKKILFTEFGYLSVDGAAGKTWELEDNVRKLDINEKAQSNAYSALLSNFIDEDYWVGGFLWKWFPNGRGHEGYPERDYTPQGKLSEKTIAEWYEKVLQKR